MSHLHLTEQWWISIYVNCPNCIKHSHKKRKDSLERRVEVTVLHTYVDNQTILEPIFLFCALKYKETKEQGSQDCLWIYIFTVLRDYCQLFFFFLSRCKQNQIKLRYNRFQKTQINTA